MPTEILQQLKTLRAGIAAQLEKDPRFLTLKALDKSIAEIGGVLSAAGLVSAEEAKPPAPMAFDKASAAPAAAAGFASLGKSGDAGDEAEAGEADADEGGDGEEGEEDDDPEPSRAAAASRGGDDDDEGETETDEAEEAADDAEERSEDGADGEAEETASAEDGDEDESEAEADADAEEKDVAEAADEDAPPRKAGSAGPGGEGGSMPSISEGRASGYRAMAAREDAPKYQAGISVKYAKLPNKVDLRPMMTAVEDQGQTNSCVANAVAGAWEYWIKRSTRQDLNVSRLFVYYNARWRDGSQDKDEGSVIQLAMESLSKFGACGEDVWPFDKRLILKKPGADAYKAAASNKVQDMQHVPLELEAWKQALAEGKPIVFGCVLFKSFDEASKRGGVVPMPSPNDLARAAHGGHAMCAVGYNDSERVFIVRNSWGSNWGDKGYCYMPYDYLLNRKFNFGDSWVFVPRVPLPPPRDVWSDSTDPVTNDGRGVDFVISPYSIDDYINITVDFFVDALVPFKKEVLEDFGQYVTFVSESRWSELESFDVTTYFEETSVEIEEEETEEEEEETEETEETEEIEETEEEESEEEDSEEDEESEEDDEDSEDEDSEEDEDSDEEEDEDSDDDAEDEESEEDESEDGDDEEDSEEDDAEDDEESDDESEDDEDAEDEDGEEDEESDDDSEDEESEEDDSEDDESEDEEDDSEDGDDEEEDSEEDDSDDEGDDEEEEEEDEEEDEGDDEGGDDEEEE